MSSYAFLIVSEIVKGGTAVEECSAAFKRSASVSRAQISL